MIKKIRIENFRGISDYKEISFVANSKRKVNKIGIKKQNKQEILKVVSLLGKNASGKSSFKEGIDFIQELTSGDLYEFYFKHLKTKYEKNKEKSEIKNKNIIGSNVIKPKNVMDLILNKEFNNPEKPIKFFIEFVDSKNTIELDITFFENGTLNEKITKNNKIFSNLKKIEFKKYSSKIYDNKNLKFKRVEFKTDF
jgi:AAA15 family ATPase/GTPase